MRRRTLIPVLFAALVLVLTAAAQASTPDTGGKPWDTEEGPRPTEVTRSLKMVIKEIRDNNVLLVVDEKAETEHLLELSETVPLSAASRKDFDGRKKLDIADLQVGHRLKVTYRTEDQQVVRIKVLKASEEG